jgi:hypothetical protein
LRAKREGKLRVQSQKAIRRETDWFKVKYVVECIPLLGGHVNMATMTVQVNMATLILLFQRSGCSAEYLTIRRLSQAKTTNTNECGNGVVSTVRVDKSLGQTHTSQNSIRNDLERPGC